MSKRLKLVVTGVRNAGRLLFETVDCWSRHDAATQSAALAYFTVFSLAPFLLVVIALAGAVFGEDAVRGQIVAEFQGLMGRDAAAAVQSLLQKAVLPDSRRAFANVIGIALVLVGTTAVFVQLQEALNKVWEVAPRPGPLLSSLLKKRFVSFALVLAVGFLLFVSLVLSAALAAIESYLARHGTLPVAVVAAGNNVLSFAILVVLTGLIYRILPDASITWREVGLGALFTSTLLTAGKWLIGLYLGRAAVASLFGAAGSLIVLLLWIYYSSCILLFGAELTRATNRVLERRTIRPEPGAVKAPAPKPR